MNRKQFLKELRELLRSFPEDELQQILDYYGEAIDDRMENGCTEEEAVGGLGDVQTLAEKIMEDEASATDPGRERGGFESKTYTASSDGIHAVVLSAENKAIEIQPSDSDEITVKYFANARQIYDFSCSDGVFRMRNTEIKRKYFSLGHVYIMPAVSVRAPRNFAGDLLVETKNGSVFVSEFPNLKSVRLQTTNSSIGVKNFSARSLELITTNGAVDFRHVSAGEKLSAETKNGKISLNAVQSPEAFLQTKNAAVHLLKVSVSGRLLAESTNGKISLDGVESPDIFLQTTNARITGTLLGREEDYTVSADTINAVSNLRNRTGGSKKLFVHTTNARISIGFQN